MHSSLELLTTIIGTSQLSFGEFKAQGLALSFLQPACWLYFSIESK